MLEIPVFNVHHEKCLYKSGNRLNGSKHTVHKKLHTEEGINFLETTMYLGVVSVGFHLILAGRVSEGKRSRMVSRV
jgi:hypothetical protein